jgi:hypothetical protein
VTFLDQIDSDNTISINAKTLAKALLQNFSAEAPHYVQFRDIEAAQALDWPLYTVVSARTELEDAGHLYRLHYQNGRPSYKLSTSRW